MLRGAISLTCIFTLAGVANAQARGGAIARPERSRSAIGVPVGTPVEVRGLPDVNVRGVSERAPSVSTQKSQTNSDYLNTRGVEKYERLSEDSKEKVDADVQTANNEIADATDKLIDRSKQSAESDENVAEFSASTRDWKNIKSKRGFLKVVMRATEIAEASNGELTAQDAFIQTLDEMNKRDRVRKACRRSWL